METQVAGRGFELVDTTTRRLCLTLSSSQITPFLKDEYTAISLLLPITKSLSKIGFREDWSPRSFK